MPHDSISNYCLIYFRVAMPPNESARTHPFHSKSKPKANIVQSTHSVEFIRLHSSWMRAQMEFDFDHQLIDDRGVERLRGFQIFIALFAAIQKRRRKKLLSNQKHKQKNEIHIYLDSIKRCIAILKVNNKYCDSPELVFYVCFHSLGRLRLQPARATHTVANIAIASSINVPTIDNKNHAFVATIWSLKNCKLCITNYDQIADGNMCNKIQHKNEFKCVRVLFTERAKKTENKMKHQMSFRWVFTAKEYWPKATNNKNNRNSENGASKVSWVFLNWMLILMEPKKRKECFRIYFPFEILYWRPAHTAHNSTK